MWCGGLIGAFAVFGALNFAPKMGAAAYVSVTILGIVTAQLDHFGAVGFQSTHYIWKTPRGRHGRFWDDYYSISKMKTLNYETAPLGFNELKKDLPTAIVKG